MHCLFFLKMFGFCFFFFFFYAVFNSVQVSFLLFVFPLSCHPLKKKNSLIHYFFLNFVSASLYLYLNIVTMGSCTPIYSISNKYLHNEQYKTESIRFFTHTPLSPILCFKISSSTQWSGLLPNPQNSQPHSRGTFTTQSGH